MTSADPVLDRIASELARLLPPGAGIGAARPADPALLQPAERTAIARAIPARQREFAGGRLAARLALAQIGHADHAIPMGTDRAPIWPGGLCGSITHHAGLCLAAVSADPALAGLGIDLEPDEALPPDLLPEILLPEEREMPARLVFSAKEAVFKALYPSVGQVFGFDAVRLSLTPDSFTAETLLPLGPVTAGTILTGRHWQGEGLILTALAMPRAVLRTPLHLDSAPPLI